MEDLVKLITVTTGLKIDETSADMFVEELCKFFLAHYGDLTVDEVGAAFSLNATEQGEEKVIFYSSFLNLEHVGQVLSKYKSKRAALVRKLHEPVTKPDAPPPTEEEQMIEDVKIVNEYYKKYLQEELTEVSMVFANIVYDIIKKRAPEYIPPGYIRTQYYEKAKISLKEQAEEERLVSLRPPIHIMNVPIYSEGDIPYSEEQKIINEGKRMTLMYMFNEFSKKALKQVL